MVIASGKNSTGYSAVPLAGTWQGRGRKRRGQGKQGIAGKGQGGFPFCSLLSDWTIDQSDEKIEHLA